MLWEARAIIAWIHIQSRTLLFSFISFAATFLDFRLFVRHSLPGFLHVYAADGTSELVFLSLVFDMLLRSNVRHSAREIVTHRSWRLKTKKKKDVPHLVSASDVVSLSLRCPSFWCSISKRISFTCKHAWPDALRLRLCDRSVFGCLISNFKRETQGKAENSSQIAFQADCKQPHKWIC